MTAQVVPWLSLIAALLFGILASNAGVYLRLGGLLGTVKEHGRRLDQLEQLEKETS